MRGKLVFGSVLALGVVLAGCGGGSNEQDEPAVTTSAGTPTVAITRTSDSNITPVSSGATTTATATATETIAAETATAVPATAEVTSTSAPATPTPTKPAAASTPVPAPTQAPLPTATPTEPAASGNPLTANMGVSGTSRYFWSPKSVTIAPGGTVTFAWSGGAAHDLSVPQLGFNTAAKTSATNTVTFPAAGTYNIVCVIHEDTMKGTVVVQ